MKTAVYKVTSGLLLGLCLMVGGGELFAAGRAGHGHYGHGGGGYNHGHDRGYYYYGYGPDVYYYGPEVYSSSQCYYYYVDGAYVYMCS